MSRHHAEMSHEVARLVNEARTLNPADLEQLHGIVFLEDGKVHDIVSGRKYDTVNEWAQETVEAEFSDAFEHIYSGGYADEY